MNGGGTGIVVTINVKHHADNVGGEYVGVQA